ncbi:hypothetical protein DYB25_009013 [Aphanomyces astaci]|uniref:Uncharacterized protein n=1 Tax=Aphanomyces astaci TaxID=112090 RepID=A0A397ASG1_APHAT|nr:hypothetical protein DYB25_009013 [Aphanomyces astaci]RHY17492.1 hypothetical protein DYB36_009835 [Aphanomyces astaci]
MYNPRFNVSLLKLASQSVVDDANQFQLTFLSTPGVPGDGDSVGCLVVEGTLEGVCLGLQACEGLRLEVVEGLRLEVVEGLRLEVVEGLGLEVVEGLGAFDGDGGGLLPPSPHHLYQPVESHCSLLHPMKHPLLPAK